MQQSGAILLLSLTWALVDCLVPAVIISVVIPESAWIFYAIHRHHYQCLRSCRNVSEDTALWRCTNLYIIYDYLLLLLLIQLLLL